MEHIIYNPLFSIQILSPLEKLSGGRLEYFAFSHLPGDLIQLHPISRAYFSTGLKQPTRKKQGNTFYGDATTRAARCFGVQSPAGSKTAGTGGCQRVQRQQTSGHLGPGYTGPRSQRRAALRLKTTPKIWDVFSEKDWTSRTSYILFDMFVRWLFDMTDMTSIGITLL